MSATKARLSGAVERAGQTLSGNTGIFATLTKEHAEVTALMEDVLRTSNDEPGVEERVLRLPKIWVELMSHARAEEQVFYAELARAEETAELAEAAIEEHAEMEALIGELAELDPQSDVWQGTFEQLASSHEAHVDEEENEIFPKARELLSSEATKALDEQYRHARNEARQILESGIEPAPSPPRSKRRRKSRSRRHAMPPGE